MEMPGGRSSRRVRIPSCSPFAVPYEPQCWSPQPDPTTNRTGGPFTTGVPYNPETGVGLLAAVAEPASARLRVAEPVRAGARRIALAVTTDLVCNGRRTCVTPSSNCVTRTPFRVGESLRACKLCCRGMEGCTIYMYMSMGFCTPLCRYQYYFLDEVREHRTKRFAEVLAAGPSKRTKIAGGKAVTQPEERRSIFFSCADAESFT